MMYLFRFTRNTGGNKCTVYVHGAMMDETRDDSRSRRRRLLERGRICKVHSCSANDGTRKREVIATRCIWTSVVAALLLRLAREASTYLRTHFERAKYSGESVRRKVNLDNNAKNNPRE